MSQKRATGVVVIQNEQGLHARPADQFVRCASRFESNISVTKEGQRIDGKSIFDVLTLAAVKGTELEIEAVGSDAESALEELVKLVNSQFATDKTVES